MTGSVQCAVLRVPLEHPAYAGHFPGNPIAPGAWLLAQAIRAFAAGNPDSFAWRDLAAAKFLRPVRPGAVLDLSLRWEGEGCVLEIREGAQAVCSARFRS